MAKGFKIFAPEDVPESNATVYPEPYRSLNTQRHVRRLGHFGGLRNYGVNLVRVEPGAQSSCRHAHSAQDEIVMVVDGPLTLDSDAGQETIETGMWVAFPAGTGDAHRFINTTDSDKSFLVIGDRTMPDTVTYPDVDMHGEVGQDGVFRFTRKNGTPY
ncbi:MAG: cupin domain-containing protein [Hyphomicrobiaceae bacterium]